MDFLKWIADHIGALIALAVTLFDRLVNLARDKYPRLMDYVDDLYGAAQDVLDDWYDEIDDYVNDWRDNLDQLRGAMFGALVYLALTKFPEAQKYVRDWYDKAETAYDNYWSPYIALVRDYFNDLKSYATEWKPNLKDLATGLFGALVWLAITKHPELVTLAEDWYDDISDYVLDWRDRLEQVQGSMFGALVWLALDHFPALRHLAEDWIDFIQALAVTWWDAEVYFWTTLYNRVKSLADTWYDNLVLIAQTYTALVVAFFDNPAQFIWSIFQATAWAFIQWWLATLLGGVNYTPPPDPPYGGGGIPPGPPGGPGPGTYEMLWPCTTRYISGYTFMPPAHNGVDIGTPTGEAVWSCAAGTVTAVSYSETGYGHRVDIQYNNGYWSRMAHLQYIYVADGQQVTQGQTVATADDTGQSSGPHLHLEIKLNGSYVNPLNHLD